MGRGGVGSAVCFRAVSGASASSAESVAYRAPPVNFASTMSDWGLVMTT